MKVLVTGGAGFIGHHVVKELLDLGLAVSVLDNFSTGSLERLSGLPVDIIKGDVLSYYDLQGAVQGVDAIVHLAALISVPESYKDPYSYRVTNIFGTSQLVRAAERFGVGRVIFASTCAVYGEDLSPYAMSKVAGERFVRDFERPWVNLRFFNVYGPEQNPAYAGVITAFQEAKKAGRPLQIHGDGLQTRDFIHVLDVASLISLLVLDHEVVGTYDVGTGIETSVNRIASFFETDIVRHQSHRCGLRSSRAIIEPVLRDAGWSPARSLTGYLKSLTSQ